MYKLAQKKGSKSRRRSVVFFCCVFVVIALYALVLIRNANLFQTKLKAIMFVEKRRRRWQIASNGGEEERGKFSSQFA